MHYFTFGRLISFEFQNWIFEYTGEGSTPQEAYENARQVVYEMIECEKERDPVFSAGYKLNEETISESIRSKKKQKERLNAAYRERE